MASGLRLNGKHALEFIALTGGRTSEVLKATWKEFDLQHRIWNVPPEHLKTGYRHGEPLPRPITRPMLAVLEEMQRRRADQSPDAIVFRSAHKGQLRPLQRTALSHLVQRLLNWEVKITNHGFRSTLRDWCRANKYPSEWWDIQVDHVLGNKTSQAYGPDKLLEERRGMMEAWGEYCTRPAPEPHSADVVKLSEKRKRRSA
jgi:integrase